MLLNLSAYSDGGGGFPACITGHMTRKGLHPGEGVCIQRGLHLGRGVWADLSPRDIWDTTGYGQQAGGTHPTGMLPC